VLSAVLVRVALSSIRGSSMHDHSSMATPGTTGIGTVSSIDQPLNLGEWSKHTDQVTQRFKTIEEDIAQKLPWHRKPWVRRWAWVSGCNLTYYAAGIAFFTQMEAWPWDDCLYFLVVSSSTVGYGDMSPSTGISMIVTLLFICFGLVVTFAQLSALTCNAFRPAFERSREWMERLFPQQGIDIDGDGSCDFKIPRAPLIYYSKNLLPPFLIVVLMQIVCAAIFCAIESWDFTTSFFHCFVTAATVGYGSPAITTRGGRWFAMLHIIISVSLLSAIIMDVDSLRQLRKEKLRKVRVFTGSMNTDLMVALDQDGNGVDRFEFVFGMLASLDIIQPKEVEPFLKLFARLDVDSNGTLTAVDFEVARAANEELLKEKLTPKSKAATGRRSAPGEFADVRPVVPAEIHATTSAEALPMRQPVASHATASKGKIQKVVRPQPVMVTTLRDSQGLNDTVDIEMSGDEESAMSSPTPAVAFGSGNATQHPERFPAVDVYSAVDESFDELAARAAHRSPNRRQVSPGSNARASMKDASMRAHSRSQRRMGAGAGAALQPREGGS
jgi:hypothetical protein